MIELFSANTPNGKKISIMLEEIGYEYTVTKIDADTFTINTANDLRVDYYQVGRKVKVTHSNGTTTGTIESTAYSSPTLTVNLAGAILQELP